MTCYQSLLAKHSKNVLLFKSQLVVFNEVFLDKVQMNVLTFAYHR